MHNLEFVELNACIGGCVGGALNVENPFIAKARLRSLRKYLPISGNHVTESEALSGDIFYDVEIVNNGAERLSEGYGYCQDGRDRGDIQNSSSPRLRLMRRAELPRAR